MLPGTGGLTRLVDKRKVRRDLADAFSTVAEGVRGQRAVDWKLVDATAPRSKFDAALAATIEDKAKQAKARAGAGVKLPQLTPKREGDKVEYEFVTLNVDTEKRVADLTLKAPSQAPPASAKAIREAGAELWALKAFRELDDALLDLRFNYPEVGVIVLHTRGDASHVLASDAALLAAQKEDWFAREVVLHMRRVLKRLDLSARTMFSLIEPNTCFAGSLFELVLASDRSFMLDEEGGPVVQLGALSFGELPMSNGLSRLESRFYGEPERVKELQGRQGPFSAAEAVELGLVTFAPDDIDWEDEVRIAIEERAAFSPDALTGMEASLRFVGPETMETKIFGRLSAWQNWIFQRPNAVGEKGALTTYGSAERPQFDFART